jgi:hypothetical protein
LIPKTTYADTGPKPSVVINFHGLENTTYYVTLLSKSDTTGPFSAWKDSTDYSYNKGDEDYDIYMKFLTYEDSGGYYFLQYFNKCEGNDTYKWGYYPPSDFKILIYFPESDSFAVSSAAYERYAFDSYFDAEVIEHIIDSVTKSENITAVKSYNYNIEGISFLARIILTIIIEIGIAFLFHYRSIKNFLIIGVTNLMTQMLLNVSLNFMIYQTKNIIIPYLLLEFIVFIIEAKIYSYYLVFEGKQEERPKLYAFIANTASLAIGLVLAEFVPMIF